MRILENSNEKVVHWYGLLPLPPFSIFHPNRMARAREIQILLGDPH
jgi:hypothetical protein